MAAFFSLIQYHDSSLLPRLSDGRVLRYIAYTEQREYHGTMILDGVCYSTLHFGRVILSRIGKPTRSQSFIDEYCLICRVLSSPGVYRRPCVSASIGPLSMTRSIIHLFKTSDLPSGEGAFTLHRCRNGIKKKNSNKCTTAHRDT